RQSRYSRPPSADDHHVDDAAGDTRPRHRKFGCRGGKRGDEPEQNCGRTRLTSGAAAREVAAAKKSLRILAGRTVSRRWPTAISPLGTHKHGCKLESDDRRG